VAIRVARFGLLYGTPEDITAATSPMAPRPGTSQRVVQACRDSILGAARRHGVLEVDAVSAGAARRGPGGALAAPIAVRIIYARQGGHEVRQSRVTCQLNGRGTVVALNA
jgi:hypothetical protein